MKSKTFQPSRKSKAKDTQPDSAESLYIRATEEEEFGDRWLGSDLAKALRFYQRAYCLYLESLRLQTDYLDSRYNVSRLLFFVYDRYVKNEAVILDELENCSEALTGTASSVVRPLQEIIQVFQESIQISQTAEDFPWDLYYNAALCYLEYMEELVNNGDSFSELVSCGQECLELLRKVLEHQMRELAALSSPEEPQVIAKEHEYETQQEAIVPPTVLETCVTGYKILATVYEGAISEDERGLVERKFADAALKLDELASTLVNQYSAPVHDFIPPLSAEDLEQLHLTRLYYEAAKADTFDKLLDLWQGSKSVEKLLLENESYRTFLAKKDTIPAATRWHVLSSISNRYKEAFELLKQEYDQLKRTATNSQLGSKIAQMCSILIERADVDLERSQTATLEEKTRNILATNANKLLRNAITYSQQSGGLRESVLEKLARRKKLKEASTRLCILEGKTSTEELDKIVGRTFWPQELHELKELGIYKAELGLSL
ncbi:hypothetical protein KL918_001144 [Ogataea parapolymorpha]|uniref:Uncharacterized protein n=1 Tax=Ogataea parapolymorpha (strain ATCC 26012 / BCRC 20466 / JCM 22074 / NRRL Y-7560 / DL-1) TaxID=871575 RepID=W1Q9L4_OGAPD|nr:hypothetical protein HPODL_01627 [Ogataea parapolymorpha DL-1]ESW97530.1 hypothetical protein HPODL_01627 [Ogataea parapolymorpha DL-1]KAG7869599.1 hypothetical protein KL918_001144 [Ogataea parapolymorpha]KAG7875348.1 hypothetical protein KL916_000019 [Ogataea parapolymorpha]